MFKIIIADDEAIFREYLRTLLDWGQHGFEICCEARNGAEALEMIKEHKPDIALVDINMPFLDGLSLVEKVNELRNDMAIILITGYSEFEYARKAVKLGVVDYILRSVIKSSSLLKGFKI
jgi:two-component system response regulator YesN